MAPEREPATPSRRPSNRGSRMDGNYLILLADSEGFEPPIPLRVLLISNQVPSAARPALPISAPICSAQRRDVKQVWRRGWDSNPRYVAVYTLSKRAPSAARPPLRSLPAPGAEERAEQLRAFRR